VPIVGSYRGHPAFRVCSDNSIGPTRFVGLVPPTRTNLEFRSESNEEAGDRDDSVRGQLPTRNSLVGAITCD